MPVGATMGSILPPADSTSQHQQPNAQGPAQGLRAWALIIGISIIPRKAPASRWRLKRTRNIDSLRLTHCERIEKM